MCDKCRCIGPWNIIEKFLSLKAEKTIKELKILKSSLSVDKDYENEWKIIKKDCIEVSKLPKDKYDKILEMLSIKV